MFTMSSLIMAASSCVAIRIRSSIFVIPETFSAGGWTDHAPHGPIAQLFPLKPKLSYPVSLAYP